MGSQAFWPGTACFPGRQLLKSPPFVKCFTLSCLISNAKCYPAGAPSSRTSCSMPHVT